MTRLAAMGTITLALLAAGCGEAEAPTAIEDPSKLSAQLEEQAKTIEERADAAVREAEALAEEELQQLRAEATAAEQANAANGAEDPAPDQQDIDN